MELVNPDLGGDLGGGLLVVAGEHDDPVDAEIFQRLDGGCRFRPHAVGEADEAADVIVAAEDHQRVRGVFEVAGCGMEFDAFVVPLFQQAMAADPVGFVVDGAKGALPWEDGKMVGGGDVKPPGPGQGEDGAGQGMGAVGLESRRSGQDFSSV